jgi:hypothetical protein
MKHPDKRPSVRPPGSRGQRRGLRPIHPECGRDRHRIDRALCGGPRGSACAYTQTGRDPNAVRVFGCLTPDLHEMAKGLNSCGIKTVAMSFSCGEHAQAFSQGMKL